jgi:hypothetical protein
LYPRIAAEATSREKGFTMFARMPCRLKVEPKIVQLPSHRAGSV